MIRSYFADYLAELPEHEQKDLQEEAAIPWERMGAKEEEKDLFFEAAIRRRVEADFTTRATQEFIDQAQRRGA